ncbi:MAG: class I SAM-dependent methyltransferase [Thermotogae bacterium]|nr:class I SAM-dependent methyltransferase [Thermotogota bacterium]
MAGLFNFDHLSPIYDPFMLPFERGILRVWRKHLWSEVQGKWVLEIGVGTGANFNFYPEGMTVFAIDRSLPMLRRARRKRRGIPLVAAEIENLPFGGSSFDDVISTLVFCSVSDTNSALREIWRVLRPGGRFHLLEHTRPRGWKGRIFDILNPITVFLMEEHINRQPHLLLEKYNFEIIKVEDLTDDGLFKHIIAKKVTSQRSGGGRNSPLRI